MRGTSCGEKHHGHAFLFFLFHQRLQVTINRAPRPSPLLRVISRRSLPWPLQQKVDGADEVGWIGLPQASAPVAAREAEDGGVILREHHAAVVRLVHVVPPSVFTHSRVVVVVASVLL
jgi:hypothetical protein